MSLLKSLVDAMVSDFALAEPPKKEPRKTTKQMYKHLRDAAKARGDKHYMGHPCIKHPGHVIDKLTKRTTSNARCVACVSEYNMTPGALAKKRAYAALPEAKKAKSVSRKRSQDMTPEEREQRSIYMKWWRQTDKGVAATNRALAKRAKKNREKREASKCSA